MDFEKTKYTQAIVAVSEREIIINSERFIGFSYIFRKKNASTYECESCKTLGKYRGVTVRNGRLSVEPIRNLVADRSSCNYNRYYIGAYSNNSLYEYYFP